MRPISWAVTATAALLFLGIGQSAFARDRAKIQKWTSDDANTTAKARVLFVKGTSLVKAAHWAEALGAFEQSHKLRPHPITLYNIGACERALGRYTVALSTLQRAVTFNDRAGGLPDSLVSEAKTYMREIERLLVQLDLRLSPSDAAIAIDGRPLEAVRGADGKDLLVAGRKPSGTGEPLPGGRGRVLVDPGTHLLSLSRKGFNDQVLTRSFEPGKRLSVELNLDKLPGQLRVSSNEGSAVVQVNQTDVGLAPVDIERPAGAYRVRVTKPGFMAYEATVNVNAGETSDIRAGLSRTPLTQKWWFWTAAGILVTSSVATTYFATRSSPAPQRPPLDGGSFNWTVRVP